MQNRDVHFTSRDSSFQHVREELSQALTEARVLWFIIGVYLILGVWFSFAVPAFETPDEIYHYAFARHLAAGNPLPIQSEVATGPWEQEGSQAPLYYMIAGVLTSGIDQSDFDEMAVYNPRANIGDPLFPGNKNRMLYSSEHRPLTGANLALHMGRWLSLLMGATTLWLLYRTARYAFPHQPQLPLVSVALIAFMPQFIFISASFSNDNMVVVASAAVLFWLAKLLHDSNNRQIQWWEWFVLGGLLGIGALSKLQALGLFALAGGVGLLLAWRVRSWRVLIMAALGASIPALLIAAWWYWRNVSLYGDWTGLGHLTAITGMRDSPLELDDFWHEFRGLRYSFWGLFGWFNILLPTWFYNVMDLVTLLSVSGAIGWTFLSAKRNGRAWLQHVHVQVRLLLLAWIVLSAVLLLYWMIRAIGSQGRLIFPALTAIAVWYAVGLDFWFDKIRKPWKTVAWSAIPLLLLSMSIYAVAGIIPASYTADRPVDDIPVNAVSAELTFGEDEPIKLLAYHTPQSRYKPGERVPLTLYLTADQAVQEDYQLFVQLLGADSEVLANVTTHPGWGRNPTSHWEPGAIYTDNYELLIDRLIDTTSPLLTHLYVGFINPDTQSEQHRPLPVQDQSGESITPLLADIVVVPHRQPSLEDYELQPMQVQFADAIEIAGVNMPVDVVAGETISVTLHWIATGSPSEDYTAFLHLIDEDGEFVTGTDRPPADGRLPTRFWREGDVIVDETSLSVPPELTRGEYEIWSGLYRSNSQGTERLPIVDSAESRILDDRVYLGSIRVEE